MWASGKTRRTDDVVFDRDACRRPTPDYAHRQYPRGLGACQNDCGAVAQDRPLARPASPHRLQNNAPPATNLRPDLHAGDRLTAFFRFINQYQVYVQNLYQTHRLHLPSQLSEQKGF